MSKYLDKNIIPKTFASFFDDNISQKIAFLLSKKLEDGHICVDISQEESLSKNGIDIQDIKNCPTVSTGEKYLPFVLEENRLYLQKYFYYETLIIDKINALINSHKDSKKQRTEYLSSIKDYILNLFFNGENSIDNPWQLIAALRSVLHNFSIISGGPGTGKTTTVAKILLLHNHINPEIRIAIAAPTGKAASRLNESLTKTINSLENIPEDTKRKLLDIKATTIHRLLKVKAFEKGYFYNSDNQLKEDLIIIDESSMIDAAMMCDIMSAISPDSKLVLVGDKNQLNSIEAGSIFGDLSNITELSNNISEDDYSFFNSFFDEENSPISQEYISNNHLAIADNITELLVSYRFDKDSDIGKFSNLIINGVSDKSRLVEPFRICRTDDQCVKIIDSFNDNELKKYLGYYEDIVKEQDLPKAFDKLGKVMILCAVVEGKYGIKYFNNLVGNHLRNKKLINPQGRFYDGQNIMITSNDYSLNLFNGDIGIVRSKNKELLAFFKDENGEIREYPVSSISNFETVYAMTIHKSQGSEYENIIIILPEDKDHQLLSREIIYTAITRAKKNVVIIAKDDVITQSVKRKISRISGIKDRFKRTQRVKLIVNG